MLAPRAVTRSRPAPRRAATTRRRRRRRSVARRTSPGPGRLAAAFLAAVAVGVGALLVAGLAGVAGSTGSPRDAVCAAEVRSGEMRVAGYSGEQLANAAAIVDTASSLGLPAHAQLLGVMAAMGESGLRNLPYGDYETSGVRNPDGSPTTSIGLFQQQDSWGTREARLDPATSARLFFERLARIPGWEQLAPTEAIHRVQVNSDPGHYARWQGSAAEVVAALATPC